MRKRDSRSHLAAGQVLVHKLGAQHAGLRRPQAVQAVLGPRVVVRHPRAGQRPCLAVHGALQEGEKEMKKKNEKQRKKRKIN